MIEELKKLIYPIPKEELDKTNIQKNIYKLIRDNIIEQNYELEVGPFTLNINPRELSAIYQTAITKVEISNKDIYYETERPLEIKYYVISNEVSETYSPSLPYFIVSGNILNIDGTTEEHYSIELVADTELNINDYLNISTDFDIVASDTNNYVIAREIKKDDFRYNTYDLFNKDKVKDVFYDDIKILFIRKDTHQKETYSKYLPELKKEKEIITLLCGTMVEFYKKYSDQNN